MATSKTNPKVDFYFIKNKQWQNELEHLRMIILESGLDEELKWGVPCYTLEKSNVVLIHGFKKYCAILFVKGALLKDSKGVLIQQTEHVQAARQIRFTNIKEVIQNASIIKAYIKEAIQIEKAGLKVELKKSTELLFPEEFQKKLEKTPALKKAFFALTPGRQRAYNLFFTAAKQSQTREARIEKCMKQILAGKGLND
jgi:uncharacterized protein YdeI (YjbR/CyaY-like superfamily)